ncbi:radical SAM protein [Candidatus Auribacterota bacterium]
MYPSYLTKYHDGSLARISHQLVSRLGSCDLCPRKCRVNRLKGESGYCGTGRNARVYKHMRHNGEEPVISGQRGSGTVFFAGCSLKCVYCQNYKFSWLGEGEEVSGDKLSGIFMAVQGMGCHNLNLVTPTHILPQIIEALLTAVEKGFNLPLVYNSSGYDSVDVLRLIEGIVDIYLPDMRYGDESSADALSAAPDYVEVNKDVIKEMYRQSGPLSVEGGIAAKGVLIRHMVLPGGRSATDRIFKFISEEVSKDIHISLMRQFSPVFKAREHPGINRRITDAEYDRAVSLMSGYGLKNGWFQDDLTGEETAAYIGENL